MGHVGLHLSPDGQTLLIENLPEAPSTIVDLETKQFQPADLHIERPTAFSADGKLLAAEVPGPGLALIDASTWQTTQTLRLSAAATAIAFSPDGRTLVTGDVEGVVKLWHVATGQEIIIIENLPKGLFQLQFSADGRTLAAFVKLEGRDEGELYLGSADPRGG
jgi:WD40 repeat protein